MLPIRSGLPPVGAEYQSVVQPDGTFATAKLTDPLPQRDPSTAVDKPGNTFTVAVTGTRLLLTQPVVVFRLSA